MEVLQDCVVDRLYIGPGELFIRELSNKHLLDFAGGILLEERKVVDARILLVYQPLF